ncbi:c-type cytochrome [Mesonia aquimarina]|uniref:c-type cytochrome n=1 Tax=Mesonia aquimarina TaxID=1504967 RepID=UPI000EF5CDE8|nr:cytochrome c [Mesonia aquimarina]
MKSLFKIALLTILVFSMASCFDKDHRNYQFFPNMYESVGYEAYGSYEVFENTQEAKIPVEGSISRGWKPYAFEDTNEGYDSAKATLGNPLPYTEDNVNKGKELYTIYCAICHGDKGDGKGTLAQREKILGIPAYNDAGRAITEGSVYHVMYYGLNTMGSYAAQTNEKERWQIDHYVMDLKRKLDGAPKREFEKESSVVNENAMVNEHNTQQEHHDDMTASHDKEETKE